MNSVYINAIGTYAPGVSFDKLKFIENTGDKCSDYLKKKMTDMDVFGSHFGIDIQKWIQTGEKLVVEDTLDIAKGSIENLIRNYGFDISTVDYLITTMDGKPTGFKDRPDLEVTSPGLSSHLIANMHFRRNVEHVPIYGSGCSGISSAIIAAKRMLQGNPEKTILLVSANLNSYLGNFVGDVDKFYHPSEIKKMDITEEEKKIRINNWSNLIKIILFGDGGSSVLMSCRPEGYALEVSDQEVLTNILAEDLKTVYLLGFEDDYGDRFHLSKDTKNIGIIYSKALLRKVSQRGNIDFDYWAFHTGSDYIVKSLIKEFDIPYEKAEDSFNVLKKYGNLTTASIGFILKDIMKRDLEEGQEIGAISFGNGFSAVFLKFVKRNSKF